MRACRPLLAIGALWFAALPALAQNANEARLRDALRQTSARLRQAEADLAQQQLATAAAQRERDAARQAAPAAPAAPVHDDGARIAALQRELEQQRQTLAAERARHAQQASAQQTALAQQQHQQQQAMAAERTQLHERLSRCSGDSDALYASGRELAGLYRDPAFVRFVRGRGRELFGMARVTRENRVHLLESQLQAQHTRLRGCLDGNAPPVPQSAAAP
ncbi:hypothetical protein [Xanthomonas floridensis]|uniref:Uncharacterized protein n=1 Tax=Xanthomonas floridensis TaxID=1843580 RepID=A0A1A9M5S6_9XANT|nr:hypothetical protein [Xanthomonas floridensis]MEA5123834.1 hypothetical protein [Xanthomonas floridensis]MEA5131513.1 hypothetical protein [Xanthomonas floridensis]OAG65685.1 hypothetical protein A7D17_08205 [Xanthomonas floridensis]